MNGLSGVPVAAGSLTRKDYTSDQEVRWCPGCGDYVILSTFQAMMADLGIARENTVIVSGIGCSSRFPYYVDCYGMHSIHGRATAIATGVAAAREDLNVWVITGDGDALSIGGNHLIHALRRNVNLTILLFNNRIYGLTKGQYSPTSELGKLTKSSPYGSLDAPFDPVALALGSGATFVARAVDSDRAMLTDVMAAAARHQGAALVEIYQNCPIFNDEAFDALKGPAATEALIRLVDGEPITFGEEGRLCVARRDDGVLEVAETATTDPGRIVVHDMSRQDPTQAFALAQLTDHGVLHRAPVGIFRSVERPAYDVELRRQLDGARAADPRAALQAAMEGRSSWQIG
ncbi:2-oxoacid:ferredoxin oxidoreductase subunit beta [Arachnia propionica]|uniref:2-oxoacid:ferredoxin oxidoreductase subunit beta n=1 Tax=Arachnia propionica TaxID=1750 RepID=A0A3P1WUU0_9ACTN|nr:2-oxoacid:ferredoxin oxidoreductase subunit beta [Arachnia propionica]RRD50352.1 2-oxoacid:ferredoxin oxidoreductase subunit beta [Arachnia propionica]